MRALVFEKKLTFRTDYPIPQPKHREALIRIAQAGICATDLEITKGYMDFQGVPGHEFVGIVEKCDDRAWEGKRVAGEINIGCGACPFCMKGMENHCPNRSVLGILKKDGAFSEYITLPSRNLHLIPDSISNDEAVFIEPLAAAFEILQQTKLTEDDKVCVFGDGKLGLLVGQVLSLTGCDLTVIGRHHEKLSILEKRGIKTSLKRNLKESFDVVVDCAGSPSGLADALGVTLPKGKIVLKTTLAERESIDFNNLVINEISLIGSRCGPFAPAIKALQNKTVNVRPLISGSYPIEEGKAAFHKASQKGILKIILKCE
jgi:threonine dehydrogenase-like Zn-dependent dehydrogenase